MHATTAPPESQIEANVDRHSGLDRKTRSQVAGRPRMSVVDRNRIVARQSLSWGQVAHVTTGLEPVPRTVMSD